MNRPTFRLMLAVLMLSTALVWSQVTNAHDHEEGSASPVAAERTAYPLTIENCGFSMTFESAPQRIVSIFSPATEMLVALGLGDRIIGTAWNDTEPMESQRSIIESLPILAEQTPSKEALSAANPDFVYITYDGGFTAEGVGTREELAGFGIATYQSQPYCGDGGHSIDDVFDDISTLGEIFDVQANAAELVEEIRVEIADVAEKIDGVTPKRVFLFDTSGDPESAPYTAACCGTADQAITAAGGANVFSEIPGTYFNYAQVAWEEVAARDPDVIVLAVFAGADVEALKDMFRNNPGLAGIQAVENDQFIVVPYSEIIPGIRAGSFVRLMAEGMHPDRFTS